MLVVPIRGSIEGSSSYALTRPPGVVIKLPAAEARVPLADYRVNDGGFGVVWVRRGEPSGLHLRFHFRAKELQHTIALAEDRVALTLSPTP